MGTFRIHVAKDYLGFCAGHFITYDGHHCETLHGHNYRVRIDLTGGVDENFYVLDFTRVKQMMKRICDELDHRMLIPLYNTVLRLEQYEDSIAVAYKHRRFVFPREDVVLLPIPNTTAEMLAQHLCRRSVQELGEEAVAQLSVIEIEVEETIGQAAVYREQFPVQDT